MPPRYKPARRAFRSEVLQAPWMQAAMVAHAEKIKAAAIAIAPVGGPGDHHPGEYKSSFIVTSRLRGGARKMRASASVTNTARHARFVEFGSEHTPRHRVFGRAIDAVRGGS